MFKGQFEGVKLPATEQDRFIFFMRRIAPMPTTIQNMYLKEFVRSLMLEAALPPLQITYPDKKRALSAMKTVRMKGSNKRCKARGGYGY